MWVHPDIIESQQWTTVTHTKSKGKAKVSSSNVVGIFAKETEEDVTSLTSSGEEESSTLKTRSSKQYLKQYGQSVASSSKPVKKLMEQSTKQLMDKQKEFCYARAL